MLGVSQSLVAQWENDGLPLSKENLERTAQALECSVAYLEGKESIKLLAGELGERIKSSRLKANLSQGELAQQCGWQQGQKRISNYEKKHRAPNYVDLTAIADVLKVSPAWLAFGDETNTNAISDSIQEAPAKYLADVDTDSIVWKDELIALPYYPDKVDLKTLNQPAPHTLYLSADFFTDCTAVNEHRQCLDVLDDAMKPVLPMGALVGVDRSDTEITDEDIYLVFYQSKLVLRFVKVVADGFQLSTFETVNELIVATDELDILGRVFWHSAVK